MNRQGKKLFKKCVHLIGIALVVIITNSLISFADSGSTPGTINDPLITKSYVDSKITELVKQQISEQLKGIQPVPTQSPQTPSTGITIVELKAGQTLYAGAGTEIIVRTGKTVAVSMDENGIPDVTAGKDLAPGTAVETNHLLIFPRDGRGIKPDPKNTQDIFVMVRGNYVLKNADGTNVTP